MKRIALWLMLMLSVAAVAQDKAQPQSKDDQKTETTKPAKTDSTASTATTNANAQAEKIAAAVPVMDGGLGACSAEFHVTDGAGKPIYGAQIHTLIKHGAFGIKKLDMQVSTNYEGRAKFTGLPDVNKRPTFFDIKQGQKVAQRVFDPGADCHPVFEVILQ